MRTLTEKGKCQSCGDYTEVYEYNKAKNCVKCLDMDRKGITRLNILRRNTGKNDGLQKKKKKRW